MLGYFCGLTHIVIGYAFILRKILESLKLTFTDFARYPAFLVYMVTIIVIIMGNRSWKKITERLKARKKCDSSSCRAWLSYICDKRRSLSSTSTA